MFKKKRQGGVRIRITQDSFFDAVRLLSLFLGQFSSFPCVCVHLGEGYGSCSKSVELILRAKERSFGAHHYQNSNRQMVLSKGSLPVRKQS